MSKEQWHAGCWETVYPRGLGVNMVEADNFLGWLCTQRMSIAAGLCLWHIFIQVG